MNKITLTGIALMSITSLFSCKQKQESNDIIIEKIVEKPQDSVNSMGENTTSGEVKWVNGASYSYTITRSADSSLEEVDIQGEKYQDNSIVLTINRNDGTEFFSGTITKSSFTGLLNNDVKQHGVLLSLAFDHNDNDNLYFVASIGSPDESSEQFALVQLIVNRMGSTNVAVYTPDEVPE